MAGHLIIAGNQKCGTTALFDMLADHPEVPVPHDGRKELHFFDRVTWWRTMNAYQHGKHRQRWSADDSSAATVYLEATPILGFMSAPRHPDCFALAH